MRNAWTLPTCLVLAAISALAAQDWEAADRATVRLKPSAFQSLPLDVRRHLEQRGCEIPQSFSDKTPHNVVKGRFTTQTETDIAVLCSNGHVSRILLFRAGSISRVAELAEHPDRNFLQVVNAGGVVGYSRALRVAVPPQIRRYHAEAGKSELPPIDHDGLEDMFVEKGSVVWYWYGGRWLELHGSD